MRRGWRGAGVGALLAFGLFALEGAQVLRSGAIGLRFDTEGPFAALFAAVRPAIPGLLARVLLAYLLAGAALGLAAAGLSALVVPEAAGRVKRAGVFLAQWLGIAAVLAWATAVERPALFDDLGWFRPALGWLASHGAPGHAWVALSLVLCAHLGWWGWRSPRAKAAPWRKVAAAASALGLLGVTAGPAADPAPAPLVVLIGVDAFRPDRLAANGGTGKVAPRLDAFAREATLFDRAYTPLAQTEPAWRSLLTARWPAATGVRYPLTAQSRWAALPTLPQALAGVGVKSHWATDCSRFNFQPESVGFSQRRQPPRGALNFVLEKLRFRALGVIATNRLGAALLPEFIDNRALAGIHDPFGYAERLAGQLVDAAAEGPTLFAWHATAAHFPGDPSYPHYRQFVREDAPLERRLRMVFAPIAEGAAPQPSEWGRADSEALYDELLAQADAQVGIVLDALKDAGRYQAATIIVFSDHGESFHPFLDALGGATPVHGARLREEENRILLMVKPAGGRKLERVSSLVRLVDLGPTVLELLKAPAIPAADGKSLAPLLEGAPDAPRLLYAETGYTHASPAAFDPGHAAGAPRTFEAYRVRPDGVVEMADAAHDGVMREKDFGAFDGEHWLVRSPRADGTVATRCDGNCAQLEAFLDDALGPPR